MLSMWFDAKIIYVAKKNQPCGKVPEGLTARDIAIIETKPFNLKSLMKIITLIATAFSFWSFTLNIYLFRLAVAFKAL